MDKKKVLVIGSSTGYGLASRISAAYVGGADTLGIMFEREASGKRTATPGYYNTKAFEEFDFTGIFKSFNFLSSLSPKTRQQISSHIT